MNSIRRALCAITHGGTHPYLPVVLRHPSGVVVVWSCPSCGGSR